MEELKKELNSKVTIDNLASLEIINLSKKLDEEIVVKQKQLMRR